MILSASQIMDVLRQAGWPDVQVQTSRGVMPLLVLMTAIALAESDGNTLALNSHGEHSVGLFQINLNPSLGRSWGKSELHDPIFNAQVALELYNGRSGLRNWGAYTDGSAFLPRRLNPSIDAYGGGGPGYNGQAAGVTDPYQFTDYQSDPYASDSSSPGGTGVMIAVGLAVGLAIITAYRSRAG